MSRVSELCIMCVILTSISYLIGPEFFEGFIPSFVLERIVMFMYLYHIGVRFSLSYASISFWFFCSCAMVFCGIGL